MTDNLMTAPELAQYLKLELPTLCSYLRVHPLARKDAQLPAIRTEGRWRFRKEDIDRWLLQHTVLPAHTRQQPRILVVDDDDNFRWMLLDLLETSGYAAQGAEGGEVALALLSEMSFDLLFVDLVMPGMSGIELIRRAKSLRADTRIIILTGCEGSEGAIEELRLEVTDTLEKPLRDIRLLESAVELALSRDDLHVTDDRKVSTTLTGGGNGNGSCLNKSLPSRPSMTNGVTVPGEVGLVGEYVGSGLNAMVKERT
ncbi:MAG: response regulator [Candidatus Methylomirabilis oxyfera]|nr:response regulator [Candidatus Methylomirabilis oxyfera]